MRLFCLIGLHKWHIQTKFLPDITSPIVTDVFTKIFCVHCNKVKLDEHLVWDGEDMVKAKDSKGRVCE